MFSSLSSSTTFSSVLQILSQQIRSNFSEVETVTNWAKEMVGREGNLKKRLLICIFSAAAAD